MISLFTTNAWALSKSDKRILKRSAGFGLVLGTAVGIATYPVAKSLTTVFTGAAVGLVTGLIVGAYRLPQDEDIKSVDPMALNNLKNEVRLTPYNFMQYNSVVQSVKLDQIVYRF